LDAARTAAGAFPKPDSLLAPGKAIRGGVPIVFPWFGSRSDGKPGPAHGFARTSEWTVESTRRVGELLRLYASAAIKVEAVKRLISR
jgi:D-hexose-6-phosphate mutarotase